MINKKKITFVLCVLFFTIIAGCNLSANEVDDFDFEYNFVTENDSEFYKKAGLEFIFINYGKIIATKFDVSFQIYDKDGIPFKKGLYSITGNTGPNEYGKMVLNLDDYFDEYDPKTCYVDYVYIPRIEYTDGSVYTDPHGLKHFLKRSKEE